MTAWSWARCRPRKTRFVSVVIVPNVPDSRDAARANDDLNHPRGITFQSNVYGAEHARDRQHTHATADQDKDAIEPAGCRRLPRQKKGQQIDQIGAHKDLLMTKAIRH